MEQKKKCTAPNRIELKRKVNVKTKATNTPSKKGLQESTEPDPTKINESQPDKTETGQNQTEKRN